MEKRRISARMLILLLSLMSAFGPISIDLYLPALPTIAADLGATESYIQLSVTGFLLGLCCGMLIYGPLSDMFGRKKIILIGSSIYIVATIICLMAESALHLVSARFFQALGAGGCIVMARTIVRDVFRGNQVARILSVMQIILMTAPLLAPILGMVILSFFGWRVLFVALLLFGSLNLLLTLFFLHETYAKEQRAALSLWQTFANYGRVLSNRLSLGYILAGALPTGIGFGFITGSPFLYINYYGLKPEYFSYLFGINIVGMMIAIAINIVLLRTKTIDNILFFAFIWLGFFSLLMIVFGGLALVLFIILTLTIMGVGGLIGSNCAAQVLAVNDRYAGAAMALNASSQFALGALSSIMVSYFYRAHPTSVGLIMGSCGLLASVFYFTFVFPQRNKKALLQKN